VCAAIIAWVVDLLGLVPFAVLGPLILTNNAIAAVVLGPPLLYLTYPRLKALGLLYPDVLRADDLSPGRPGLDGVLAWTLVIVPIAWVGVGTLLSTGAGPSLSSVTAVGAVGMAVVAIAAVLVGERLSGLLDGA